MLGYIGRDVKHKSKKPMTGKKLLDLSRYLNQIEATESRSSRRKNQSRVKTDGQDPASADDFDENDWGDRSVETCW